MDTDFIRNEEYPVQISPPFHLGKAPFDPSTDNVVTIPSHGDLFLEEDISAWALSRVRRAVDFTVSAITLAVCLPLLAAVALAVRLDSPGPALFQQERMGRNGRVFTLYKFRSMRIETDHSSPITVTGDNRITRVGRFLRRCKLDELPQFWNVLRGDMSLVGPRPKLPHHEALLMPFRPGITGAATLAFRFEEEMLSEVPREHLDAYYERYVKPSKAQIDWDYMRTATPGSDLGMLWLTAKTCLSSNVTPKYAVLPEFSEVVDEFILQETSSIPEPAFSTRVI